MYNNKNEKWLKEMKDKYEQLQQKWLGQKHGSPQQEGFKKKKPGKKYNQNYCEKAMNYYMKKFKDCDQYGKEADKCRKYCLQKYKEFKLKYEQSKQNKYQSCKDKQFKQNGHKPPHPVKGQDCYQTYQCLLKLLNHVCAKYKKT